MSRAKVLGALARAATGSPREAAERAAPAGRQMLADAAEGARPIERLPEAVHDVRRFVNTNMGYARSPEEVEERLRAFAALPRLADPEVALVADDPDALRLIQRLVLGQRPYEHGRATPDDLAPLLRDLDERVERIARAAPATESAPQALPPVENSRLTQVATTGGTYQRAGDVLRERGVSGPMIDYGAGRGHGTRYLGSEAESFEPYPNPSFRPTYTDPSEVPSDRYAGLVNLNVLNVLPPEVRDRVVREMGRVVRPEGQMVITTRGRDVMAARGTPGPEPMSLVIGEGDRARYQKGFTQAELREYLQRVLGPRFEVEGLDLGPAGALVRRLYGAAPFAGLGAAATAASEEDREMVARYAMGGAVDADDLYNPNFAGDEGTTAMDRSLEGLGEPQRLSTGGRARSGPPPARPPVPPEQLREIFADLERRYDLPEGYLARVRAIESSDGTRLYNRRSGAAGPFQFIPRTARAMGLNDPYDEAAAAEAAARYAANNARALRRAGVEIDAPTLYLAHQQGATGAVSLLQGNRPATEIVGRNAVLWNGGDPNMTGPQFAGRVFDYFRGQQPAATTVAAAAPAEATAPAPTPAPAVPAVAPQAPPQPQQQLIPPPPPPAPPIPQRRAEAEDRAIRDVMASLEPQGQGGNPLAPIERHLQMVQAGQRRYATPMPEVEQPVATMAQGGLARTLGSMGRGNDTLVAHITPREALALMAMGGSGTINPYTGLLEFDDGGGGDGGGGDGSDGGGSDSGGGTGDEGGGSSEDGAGAATSNTGPDATAAVSDAIGAGFGPESSGYGNQGGPGPNASSGMSAADPEGTSQAANMSTATAAQNAGLGVGIADTGGVNPTGFAAAPGLAETAAAFGRGDIGLAQALGFGLQAGLSPPGVQIGTMTDQLGLQSPAASINPVGLGAGIAGTALGIATGMPGLGLATGALGSALGNALGVGPSIVSYSPGEGPMSNNDGGGGESDPLPPGVGFNLPEPVTAAPVVLPPSTFTRDAPVYGRAFVSPTGNLSRYGFGGEQSFYRQGFAEGGLARARPKARLR